MTGVVALAEALERGGKVVWDREPPRLLVPPDLRPRVEADRGTVREILRRAAVFRAQAQARSLYPFLHLPEATHLDRGCLSCGAPVDEAKHFRCPLCVVAVGIALDLPPLPNEVAGQ